jgi:transposase
MEVLYVGIDVGKENLDVFYANKASQINNNVSEIKKFLYHLASKNPHLNPFIICEATGGYERELVSVLKQENMSFHVAHPNKIRAFAKSKGILAKTDKIDAKVICNYGEMYKPEANIVFKTQAEETLTDLVKRHDQLVQEKVREQNKLDKIHIPAVIKSIKKFIRLYEKEIEIIDKQIVEIEGQEEKIHQKVKLYTSIPAIGKQVAYHIISYLPEIGHLSHKQISALVGVAPFNRESGKLRGKRSIYGGRGKIRSCLYMSALSSIRCYKEMRCFYQKLKRKGKPSKVALTAVMRKLLLVLNSIAKKQTPWVQNALLVAT